MEEEKRIRELNQMLQKQISVLSQQNQEDAQTDLKIKEESDQNDGKD